MSYRTIVNSICSILFILVYVTEIILVGVNKLLKVNLLFHRVFSRIKSLGLTTQSQPWRWRLDNYTAVTLTGSIQPLLGALFRF